MLESISSIYECDGVSQENYINFKMASLAR